MKQEIIGNEMVLILTESLTANYVPVYNAFIEKIFEDSLAQEIITLDFANIDNIDSVGVTFIIALYKRVKSKNKTFRVKGANDDVQDLFKLMKLDHFFDMSY